jgi:hypothetical protein
MKKLLRRLILRLLPPPGCVYYANLTSGVGMVPINVIGAGPLLVGSAGTTGDVEPVPGSNGQLLQPEAGYVHLSFTKPIEQMAGAVVHCALTPVPALLPRVFGMVGHFQLPPDLGPSDPGVQWAAVLGVRASENLAAVRLVGATHQVRNLQQDPGSDEVRIALGVGNAAVMGSVTPAIDPTRPSEVYPDPANRVFTLETVIDSKCGTGTSWLRTPGDKVWAPLSWLFDFKDTMTALAFGLAMPSGGGTPRASIDAFYIYNASLRRWWWEPVNRVRELVSTW